MNFRNTSISFLKIWFDVFDIAMVGGGGSVAKSRLTLGTLYPARLRCTWEFTQARIPDWVAISFSRI